MLRKSSISNLPHHRLTYDTSLTAMSRTPLMIIGSSFLQPLLQQTPAPKVEIMKRLPVKSLIQLRSVSKSWKSLIDSADFVKHYSGQMQHLLTRIIGSSRGLLCLFGDYQKGCDGPFSGTGRVVLWNPSIRKVVVVDVPNVADGVLYDTVLGFGVCGEANDPKIVKITHINMWGDMRSVSCIPWQVEVFTLSTRAWRSSYSSNLPCKPIEFDCYNTVVIDGVLYWLANDTDGGTEMSNLIISFDMTNEEFREVNLPDSLAQQSRHNLSVFERRESLVVLESDFEDNKLVFRVWMMEDGVPKSFTKLFTVCIPDGESEVCILGFRKTGEPLIDSPSRYPEWTGSLAVYEPYSKSISNLGISGSDFSYVESSYIETLLLLG